jgi:surface antigen
MLRQTIFAIVLLPLGACAMLGGADPALYGALSDEDVALAARLVQNSLEQAPDGAMRRWRNDTTGHSGTITPVRTYVTAAGHFCRDYQEEIAAGGRQGRFLHTACRADDARWVWL